tara:strand:- start:290 stop:493 length:204 start_codon:yes stop_codon:yes gene_type:complete
MAKIKNVCPLGDLYVPELGLEIKFGETVEVPDEMAARMLEAPFNWSSGDSKKTSPDPVKSTDIQEEK